MDEIFERRFIPGGLLCGTTEGSGGAFEITNRGSTSFRRVRCDRYCRVPGDRGRYCFTPSADPEEFENRITAAGREIHLLLSALRIVPEL